ncbi:glycosyltransferase [Luteimonas sp. A501]
MAQVAQFSVIIPVFNDQAGVTRCLRALAQQVVDRRLVEVVIVDNGSEPPILVEHVDALRVVLVRCETPGSYAARNAGVAASSGRILAFTDADCVPDSRWLESGGRAIEAHPAQVVGGEVFVERPTKRTGTGLYQHLVGFRQRENIEERGFAVTANLLCSRETFREVGEFETALLSGGDQEWCLRAAHAGAPVRFEPSAIVRTEPRTSLNAAICQARRVAAGRRHLIALPSTLVRRAQLHHRRNRIAVLHGVLSAGGLSVLDRFRIIGAAALIFCSTVLERVRLCLGGAAERR